MGDGVLESQLGRHLQQNEYGSVINCTATNENSIVCKASRCIAGSGAVTELSRNAPLGTAVGTAV